MVPILTAEAEAEILYPNYHGCELLRIVGRYVGGGGFWTYRPTPALHMSNAETSPNVK